MSKVVIKNNWIAGGFYILNEKEEVIFRCKLLEEAKNYCKENNMEYKVITESELGL